MENEEKTALAGKLKKLGANISDELGYDFVQQQAERATLPMQRNKLGRAMVLQQQALKEMMKYTGKAARGIAAEINLLADKITKSQERIWDKANAGDMKDILPDELKKFSHAQDGINAIRQEKYNSNQAFRLQNTDIFYRQSAALYEQVENALKEEEKEAGELDPVETETIIE